MHSALILHSVLNIFIFRLPCLGVDFKTVDVSKKISKDNNDNCVICICFRKIVIYGQSIVWFGESS